MGEKNVSRSKMGRNRGVGRDQGLVGDLGTAVTKRCHVYIQEGTDGPSLSYSRLLGTSQPSL